MSFLAYSLFPRSLRALLLADMSSSEMDGLLVYW